MLHLWYYLVYVYCIFLSFLYLFILRNFLSQNCSIKTSISFFFPSRRIWKHVLIFFGLIFFKGTYFEFYLIVVLLCYLYFITYCKMHNVFGTLWWVSFLGWNFAGDLELGKKWALSCSRNITLFAIVFLGVFNFQGVLYHWFLIFSALFYFNLCRGNYLTIIL